MKDAAVAIYWRDIALRYLERQRELPSFDLLSAGRARELALIYFLNYLVTDKDLPLPVVYKNQRFKVYQLER